MKTIRLFFLFNLQLEANKQLKRCWYVTSRLPLANESTIKGIKSKHPKLVKIDALRGRRKQNRHTLGGTKKVTYFRGGEIFF